MSNQLEQLSRPLPQQRLHGIKLLPIVEELGKQTTLKVKVLRQHETFLFGLALLLVSFFSLFLIGGKSFWLDEAYSIQLVRSWGSMWSELFRYDRNSWFYYLLLYGWSRLGDSEAYLRGLSALFAIASLPVYYLLSKKLFGTKVALIAAFLLAVNGFYISYAQEARTYSLYFFLSLVSTLLFLHLRHKQSKWRYFLYTVCVTLSIYAHALAVFLLAIHALIVLFTSRSFWKQYALCASIAIACAFPIVSSQGHVKNAVGWLPPVHISTLPRYFLTLSAGQPILFLLYAILCGIATLWIMRIMRRARTYTPPWKYAFVYIWLFLPPLLTFFYSLLISPAFLPRFLIIGLAPFLLLVSIGLTKIPHRLLFYLGLVSIGVLSLLSLISWYTGDPRFSLELSYPKEDWRTAVAYVCTDATVNDGVTFYAYHIHNPYDYYAQKSTMCLRKHLHEIELASAPYGSGGGGSLPAPNMLLLKHLPTSTSRVWLMISHDYDTHQRDMILQMLATNYSLVSTKKFEGGIEVQLYARSIENRPDHISYKE
jgi:mannosyltransferase